MQLSEHEHDLIAQALRGEAQRWAEKAARAAGRQRDDFFAVASEYEALSRRFAEVTAASR